MDETIKLRRMSTALETEKAKTEELLHSLIPKKIANQLTSGRMPKAGESNDPCQVVESDIRAQVICLVNQMPVIDGQCW